MDAVDHPPQLGVLLPEGFHDPHAVHVFVDDLGDIAFALLAVPGGREDAPPHPVGNDQKGRRHDHADDGQQRRQVDHHGQRHHHQQEVAAHDGEEAEEALHQGRVRVGPGHQLPGGHAVQVVEVHRLKVVVHVVAQVVLDPQRHPAAPVAADIGKAESAHGQHDEQH